MNYYKVIYILFFNFWIIQGFSFQLFKNIKHFIKIKNSKIDKINGFYGLIGPNINFSKTNTLFELFTGDGIIQGVFLENGKISEITHIIQTEKIQYEKKNGKFLNIIIFLPMYMFLNKLGMIPNVMGLANTAFIKINHRLFVLFERDLPYEISLDFYKKEVKTLKKINIKNINHFSAHSIFDKKKETVYSLEYNILQNIVSLFNIKKDLVLSNKIDIKTKYLPIIHDSYILSNSTIFTDSPLQFSIKNLIQGKIPVIFNNNNPTYIYEISRKIGSKNTYVTNESFYIFHYAEMRETNKKIVILAPIYDYLDFSDLNINGKYRKLILDKDKKTIEIQKNKELEKYNLDFPIKWRDSIILRNVDNMRINGFIVCKDLHIQKKIFLDNLSICGEPQIYDNGYFSRIICLGYNRDMKGYFILINPENGEVFEFPINKKINIGFHSIFIENN
jgi:hypothetical protein